MRARHVLAVIVLVAVAASVWVLTRDASAPARPGASPAATPAVPSRHDVPRAADNAASAPQPAAPATPGAADVTAELAADLAANDAARVQAAARELRHRLRSDDDAWRAAAARLLDPATPEALREALAMILGTIDGERTDPLLLDALRRFGATPAFARAALLALGATRTPPDDDVFALGDRPWGADGPGGIGITVNRPIESDATRAAVAAYLHDGEPTTRWAAATTLRHSLQFADAGAAFLAVLPTEPSDDVAGVLGESLAGVARRATDPGERERLLAALVARAGEEGLDGYRFRMEDEFTGVAIPVTQRSVLATLAASSRNFGIRSFALGVLAETAAPSGGDAVSETRRLLVETLAADRGVPARDLAARLLRKLPLDDAARSALESAARHDSAWNVRYTALETYAQSAPADAVQALLAAAASDPDERVRDLAKLLSENAKSRPR